MARPESLPQGQIAPAAKPVDAFINPVAIQVAAPAQPTAFPSPTGISTLQTGQTTGVQGYNNSTLLAEALQPFSKELVQATQTAGLMYADWRMQKGEAQAREAVRRAQAANDQSTEAGQLEYAAANRALAVKDPQAGWAMHMLDPYTQMGWERGKAKAAGLEIEAGMQGFVAQRSGEIDYTAPDQGFAALQRIRADYIAQVTGKYGISDASHGFQKYAAPSIEKASGSVAQKIAEDRVKFFDENKPKELANLIVNTLTTAQTTGSFEYKGRTFTKEDGPLFSQALGQKINDEARAFLAQGGLPGQASKWSREAYQILRSTADYAQTPGLGFWLSTLRTSEPLRGADGKPVLDANGQQVFLSWEDKYAQEKIDSQIKYEQAGFTNRAARAKDTGDRGAAVIAQATQGMAPGEARYQAGAAALNTFIQKENEDRRANGQPPMSAQEEYAIRKGWKEANELNSDLLFERDDPRVEVNYFGQLAATQGSNFDAARERTRVRQLAATIRDPERASQFLNRANAEIERKEKEVQDFTAYAGPRDKVIKDNIDARLQRNYLQTDDTKADRVESERRQRTAYTPLINDRIKAKEAQLGRKLNEAEVRAVSQETIDQYGSKDKDALQYLFPGSLAYPNSPSVDPNATQRLVPLGPDGKPKPNEGKPIPTVYDIKQLDNIPNRRQVLVEYENKAVLSLNAVRQGFFAAIAGKPLPAALERAWRDAQAPNAYVFLERQLEMYPNYRRDEWTLEELKKAKQRLTSSAAYENQAQSYATLSTSSPLLASLLDASGQIANTFMGIAPAAAAATSGGGGDRPFTGSPAVGGDVSRFRAAIFGQESGGDYRAVNPHSGALGVGQVMPANVGPWTEKYLGRRLTPQQFLADSKAQDTVINGRFADMFEDQRRAGFSGEQMVRRAAAVWYSGQAGLWNDTRPQYYNGHRYPSIAEYTKSIWDNYRR